MKEKETINKRIWAAALLSTVLPGLGQIYNGELLKGACFFTGSVLLAFLGMRVSVFFPDPLMLPIIVLSLILYLGVYALSIINAVLISRKRETPASKSWNRWYFYLTAWLAGIFIMFSAALYINNNIFVRLSIAGTSMEPAVSRGDTVLLDKTAGERTPYRTGDIVVFTRRGRESRLLMRRIVAFAGEEVLLDGEKTTVPEGSVFVKSDNPAADTRGTGELIILEEELMGRVRVVF